MLKTAFLALIFAAGCLAQRGSISGTVTSVAGEPLKNATLTLRGQSGPQPQMYAASSDAQGNFTLEDLDPGSYTLVSERAGYLRENYGSGSISLTAGQSLTGIGIKMSPQALISGRITDEDGEPYPNLQIRLARWAYVGGRKQLQQTGSAASNAEGVFSMGNLAAGAYYIAVLPPPSPPVQKGPPETYVTTYYPGVTEPSGAIAVQVSAGAVVRGLEIRMRKARAFRVRGKLVDLSGAPPPANTNLLLLPKDGPSLPSPTSNAIVRDGIFVFGSVLPGVYILQAMPTGRVPSGMARLIFSVGDADVDDLLVELGPGAEITGTISTDGAAPPQQPQQPGTPGINARPAVLITAENTGNRGETAEDGTFAINHIMPGAYRVSVQPLPPGTYVKSIRFGGQDLLKSLLDLTSSGSATLNVVLSANAGDIGGIVHGADGTPAGSVLVTLWTPGIPAEGATDFNRTVQADANGQFKFAGLPPGDYRIAAWEQIDYGLGAIPEFRIKFESKAAAVKLEEGAHESVEAPLIGRDAIATEAAKLQ